MYDCSKMHFQIHRVIIHGDIIILTKAKRDMILLRLARVEYTLSTWARRTYVQSAVPAHQHNLLGHMWHNYIHGSLNDALQTHKKKIPTQVGYYLVSLYQKKGNTTAAFT